MTESFCEKGYARVSEQSFCKSHARTANWGVRQVGSLFRRTEWPFSLSLLPSLIPAAYNSVSFLLHSVLIVNRPLMSQVKAPPTPTPVQPPHATSHGQPQALSPPTRITTRRSSRSAHSTMATNNNSKDSAHDSSSTAEEVTSPESTTSGVTTRSKSMDTQATEDTSNPPDPIQQDTKKKKTNTSKPISSRKRSAKQSSASPTTPIPSSVPTLRASKASSTRAAKRIDALAPRASVRRKRKEPSDGHAPEIDAEHKRQR